MKKKPTGAGSRVLAELMALAIPEQQWVREQYVRSLEADGREELRALLDGEEGASDQVAEHLYNEARERLLEDPGLTAGEKVLLAALVLKELYEVEEFHSRQITEHLKEASNTVNNITAALNGLMAKGEAEVVDVHRSARNAHKRYRLTPDGISAAVGLARSRRRDRISDGAL